MLGQKTSLHKLKKIEIISNIFCNHTDMKLEISHKKMKIHKYVKIKQHATEQPKSQKKNKDIKK